MVPGYIRLWCMGPSVLLHGFKARSNDVASRDVWLPGECTAAAASSAAASRARCRLLSST
jgi:hypothetical protein